MTETTHRLRLLLHQALRHNRKMSVEKLINETISSGGKCSYREYRAIWDDIRKQRKPVNFLVFGTGFDTPLWETCNHKGNTVFIENNPKWVDFGKKKGHNVVQVAYKSSGLDKKKIYGTADLLMDFGKEVEDTNWTHIFVDGPVGRTQSRMKSIFNAARLAGPETKIFVHDYNRPNEKLYVDYFLKLEEVIHRLAVCRSM